MTIFTKSFHFSTQLKLASWCSTLLQLSLCVFLANLCAAVFWQGTSFKSMQRGNFMSSYLVKGKTGVPALYVGALLFPAELYLQQLTACRYKLVRQANHSQLRNHDSVDDQQIRCRWKCPGGHVLHLALVMVVVFCAHISRETFQQNALFTLNLTVMDGRGQYQSMTKCKGYLKA